MNSGSRLNEHRAKAVHEAPDGQALRLDEHIFPSARAFARYMLAGNRLTLAPMRSALWHPGGHGALGAQRGMTSILYRDGCWQVELLMIAPGSQAPMHRHNHCESADVLLNGDLYGTTGGRPLGIPRGANLAANIQCIPRGAWHGGGTNNGLVALSFQRWIGCEPKFIAQDWETPPSFKGRMK